MSNLSEWIKNELYPNLYNHIDSLFPEHNFKSFQGGWRSKTYLNGENHKSRIDKTIISKKAPGYILEQGGETLSIIDYIKKRENLDFLDTLKYLVRFANIDLPYDFEKTNTQYTFEKSKSTLYEVLNNYFIQELDKERAIDGKNYLLKRGYSNEVIREMELGFISEENTTKEYLISKGFEKSLIKECLAFYNDKRVGETHSISIPYRSGGNIKGFKFRTIDQTNKPKYLNSVGLDKNKGFFNLLSIKGDKDLIIVEGELDALHASVLGIENVVSLGGNSLSEDQIKDAIKKGAKSFTLCFDFEKNKIKETFKKIKNACEIVLNEGIQRVYIAHLPDIGSDKTDPDSLIKEKGIELFKDVIHKRNTYGTFIALELYRDFLEKSNNENIIDFKERDLLRENIVAIRSTLSTQNRLDFNNTLVKPLADFGFTEDILTELEENFKQANEEAKRNKDIERILRNANQISNKADTLKFLKESIKEIEIHTGKSLLPEETTFNAVLESISKIPPSYKTGYKSLDSFIGFAPSAISLIAGRPSHGKTTFMFNLLIQMSELYKDETFYFFSYEEPTKNISLKLLNKLINYDLSPLYKDVKNLAKPTNYEFLKTYIKQHRTDVKEIEEGKMLLKEFIDSDRIKIIDKNYSVEELSSIIHYINKKERVGGIIIDYIQRMRTERKTQDKRTEIAHISDIMLQTAKESGLPIILGAQLNRDAKNRPALENLKEAGNLEEDANTVISVYCKAREEEENEMGEKNSKQRHVELEIKTLKNREGEVNASEKLIWDRWTGTISENKSKSYDPFKIN
jgi:DNA primase catalytic core